MCASRLRWVQINQPQKAREAFQRILDSPELPEARRKAVYWVARARFEEVRLLVMCGG